MVGGLTRVNNDVPPFMIVEGNPSSIRSLNSVGLQRAGVSRESREELKMLYRLLFRSDQPLKISLAAIDVDSLGPEARELVEFYSSSERGITPHRARRA